MTKQFVHKFDVVEAVKWAGDPETANEVVGERYGVDWVYRDDATSAIKVYPGRRKEETAELNDWLVRDADGDVTPVPDGQFREDYVPLDRAPAARPDKFTPAQVVAAFFETLRRHDPAGVYRLLKSGFRPGEDETRLPDGVTVDGRGCLTVLSVLNYLLRLAGDDVAVLETPRGADGSPLPVAAGVTYGPAGDFPAGAPAAEGGPVEYEAARG